ncbi:hypothetical protein [Paraglaciecola sp. 20A4]|uniref:hypothetical protein n=1 Tax=Paraglaciecola sp. 20A4 TaxID=2687288 RepID=UPI001409F188|nr:hypothetical protein [Paraglaciecola sp. 20A4]
MLKSTIVLLNVSFLLFPKMAFSNEAELFQFYPDCDYDVIDTVNVSGRLRFSTGSTLEESLDKARLSVIEDILQLAREKGADGAILTEKSTYLDNKTTETRISRNRVIFKAELVNNCYVGAPLSENATPFDEKGFKKRAINFSSNIMAGAQHVITYDIDTQRSAPAVASQSINFTQGAFGLPLSSTYQQMLQHFGTPTGTFILGNKRKVVSYGRDFWLTFQDQKLISVTNKNVWLSNELLSMMAFDRRFELQNWQVLDSIKFNMPMTDIELLFKTKQDTQHVVRIKQDGLLITLHGAASRVVLNELPEYGATFYSLSNATFTVKKLNILTNQSATDELSKFIEVQGGKMDIEALKSQALGSVRSDNDSTMLIMDNHIVLDVKGQALNKVYLLDSAFSKTLLNTDFPWQIGKLKQGSSIEYIKGYLGDDIFGFGDMLEVSNERYIQELYFSDYDTGLVLDSSEITVF